MTSPSSGLGQTLPVYLGLLSHMDTPWESSDPAEDRGCGLASHSLSQGRHSLKLTLSSRHLQTEVSASFGMPARPSAVRSPICLSVILPTTPLCNPCSAAFWLSRMVSQGGDCHLGSRSILNSSSCPALPS